MFRTSFVFLLLLLTTGCATNYVHRSDVQQFIQHVSVKDNFQPQQLNNWFAQVKPNPIVIKTMTTPHESLPWYQYRKIFLMQVRVNEGVKFWQQNADVLAQAEKRYQVAPEIIVAILGVETKYGQLQGKFGALESLATLSFDYPKRGAYFQTELEQYLLLTRDAQWDPLTIKSSYAGALGMPQFMPSSYRNYAVTMASGRYPNLFSNVNDAVMSVANYFHHYGWQYQQAVTAPAKLVGNDYLAVPASHKPNLTLQQLNHYGVYSAQKYPVNEKVYLLALADQNRSEYWLAFNNFYVITRYNTSPLYAMAVYQLSQQIKAQYQKTFREHH